MAAPPLPPSGVFTYPGDTQIQDILLLPDGRHALALFRVGSVNLWSVLVYHWLEIVTAITVCVLLLVLNHLVRRPRSVGKPYCRQCNYLLIGVGDVCPECGVSLAGRNRVTGRSRWLRFVLFPVLIGSIVGSYAVVKDRVTRDGSVNSWCLWLSPAVYDWAYHNDQAWLTRHKSTRCRVVEIDLADGAVTRTLFSRDGIMPGEFALAPDGTSFFLSQGEAVSQHDLRSGRRIASLRAEDVGEIRFREVTVDALGDTVYVASTRRTVWAWHPADGTHEVVAPTWGMQTVLVPYRDRAVSWSMGTGLGRSSSSTLRDLLTGQTVAMPTVQQSVLPIFRPSQDGSWIVCPEDGGFGVWAADTGVRRHTIPVPWLAGGPEVIMTGADARFVVLPRYGPTRLYLWDLEKSAWAGSCAGQVSIWIHALLSADRSVMAAVGVKIAAGNTQYMILTWDLTQLSREADSADHDLP